MLNRLLHYYWRLRRGMTLGVRAVVLGPEGVLLVRHGYAAGWHLPGGGVEPGETFGQALARELAEETGVRLTVPPELHGIFQFEAASKRDHVAVYVVRGFERWAAPKPNWEIREARFFPLDALPEDASAGVRRRLEEILQGREKGEGW
ncbi:MAG TPA: NUDIX domain-containing protein [Xanthobacteraceae bacterium]|nr:NUDIX domain-containing protein [Xanthobacteraceae bacterium]